MSSAERGFNWGGHCPSTVIACLLASLLFAVPHSQASPVQGGLPNIIIILADDLGFGDVSIYNPEGKILTPTIDALARDGIYFTDAHSGAGVCSPSRYGLLTGQHYSRQPWIGIKKQLIEGMIDSDRLTLGKLLQNRGYHSGVFGKWHLGQTFYNPAGKPVYPSEVADWSIPSTGGPNDLGFDQFFGVAFGHNHFLHAFMRNRLVTQAPTIFSSTFPAKAKDFSPEQVMPAITEEFLRYIDWNVAERPGKPFFAYFAPVSVHAPLTPSEEFIGVSSVGLYGDFVVQIDAAVSAMMERLRDHGIDDNTLVIFSSDNGSHGRTQDDPQGTLYRPGSIEKRYQHRVNGQWRGYKGSVYEGAHRVPFIARWPSRIPPGEVSHQLITLEDVLATVADIVRARLPEGSAEDSYNILPYLEGSYTGAPLRRYAVFNTRYGSPVLRLDEWVYAFHLKQCEVGVGNSPMNAVSLQVDSLVDSYLDTIPFLVRQRCDLAKADQQLVTAESGYPMLRRSQWLLSYLPAAGDDCADCGQLYNLGTDPAQLDNQWRDRPEVVRYLKSFHEAHVQRGSSFGIVR